MVVLHQRDEDAELNKNYILYWNHAALELVRLTHTQGTTGPVNGPPIVARMLGILHLAIHDALFAIETHAEYTTYLSPEANVMAPYRLPAVLGATDARQAVAGAAITVLRDHYTMPTALIARNATNAASTLLAQHIREFPGLDSLSSSYRFGVAVGKAMLDLLAIRPGDPNNPGTMQGDYSITAGKYKFNDDPTNPVRLLPIDVNDPEGPKVATRIYHAPFYGMTAKRLGVQYEIQGVATEHILADPPIGYGSDTEPGTAEYQDAFRDVVRMGGAPSLSSTKRRPFQTAAAHFWAYDGSNLIGVPLRLYNQIIRTVAWYRRRDDEAQNNADFARLFALANVAMADAGIFAWLGKYDFEFWRPLSGVREDSYTPGVIQDPFWLELGAPSTNSNEISFKPPFPSYPSGHATFGAAGFQAARLFYKHRDDCGFDDHAADNISFSFISDELDGLSRDALRKPFDPTLPISDQQGIVRTRWERQFDSLWDAMHENAVSRVWLGVHWRFDAFAAEDTLVGRDLAGRYSLGDDGTTKYKPAADVAYVTRKGRVDRSDAGEIFPVGGVPLGIGIADDIFYSGLKPTPVDKQPKGRSKSGWSG